MELLTLPEPAASLWRRASGALERALAQSERPPARWSIGGGTILAQRWGLEDARYQAVRILDWQRPPVVQVGDHVQIGDQAREPAKAPRPAADDDGGGNDRNDTRLRR